ASKRKLKGVRLTSTGPSENKNKGNGVADNEKTPSKGKEHYSKLWEYRLAMLKSNPESTCHLDVEEDDRCVYFKRFYVCFKGLKDGWKAGCRRVIGIDGSFLTHTYKGELLTAMGRDANNQMFPVAWAVVGVENTNN
nr:hypothetical protein CTI12_AA105810 [Tanacetum cinerariifolium]